MQDLNIFIRHVRKWKAERGSNMVEFALVFVIATLLIFGLIDLSRAVYTSTALEAAAQAGVRYGITAPHDTAGIEAAVKNNLTGVDTDALKIAVTRANKQIEVNLEYEYEFLTPIMAQLINANSFTLHANARMSY